MAEKDIVEAWLANQAMRHLERYLRGGRHLRDVSTGDLQEWWAGEMNRWASICRSKNPGFDHTKHENIEAALSLRKVEPPFDQVSDALATIRRASDEHIEELKKDPEKFARRARELDDAIKHFESETKRERN